MLAQTPWNNTPLIGTALTESRTNGLNIIPSFAIAYGIRDALSMEVCSVPSEESIRPTEKRAIATPVARLRMSPPKNLLTTAIATEESFETDAIVFGSNT